MIGLRTPVAALALGLLFALSPASAQAPTATTFTLHTET